MSTAADPLAETEKVFIETFSSGEILQADLEIFGVLLTSLLYFLISGVVWGTTTNVDFITTAYKTYASTDYYSLGKSIRDFGGLSITGTMFIFHIMAMLGVLNEINMMLMDWVMGLAYPVTMGVAMLFWYLAAEDQYTETAKLNSNIGVAVTLTNLIKSELTATFGILAAWAVTFGSNYTVWKYGQEFAMMSEPEEEAA